MKYLFKSAWLLAAGATLLAACSTDDTTNPAPTPGKVQVSFGATLPQKGRSTIEIDEENGRFSGAWESTDAITLYANDTPERFGYDPNQKVFTGELPDQTTNWTYRAVYPYVENEPLKIPFGSARTQQGNAFNGDYDPLLSDEVSVPNAKPGVDADGQPVIFGLERLTAIVALTFTTSDSAVAAEKVTSVTLTAAEGTLANDFFTIDPGSSTGSLTGDNASSAVTISYAAESAPTAASFKAFFNVPAGTYGKLTATIRTEGHTATVDLTAGATLTAGELIYNPNKAITNWQAAETGAPTMEWVENPDFTDTPIEDGMQVHVNLKAPAGIKVFGITINSAILAPIVTNPEMNFGFSAAGENTATIDLVQTPNETLMELLGLTSTDLTSATEIPLDLSQLIPLIKMIGAPEESKHIFTLKLVDKNDTPLEKSLTFYIPKAAAEPTATFSDIDLWANTAKITLTNAPEGATVQYKRADEVGKNWNTLTAESDGSFKVAPVWTDIPADTLTLHTVDRNTGIFAGTTYNWQILNGEAVVATGTYSAPASSQVIENSSLEEWVDMTVDTGTVQNPKGWSSGNNDYMSFIMGGVMKKLCTASTFNGMDGNTCAKLQPQYKMTFAAGNLFTGSFVMPGNNGVGSGNANFGIEYPFDARPYGLHVKYHATVSTIDQPSVSEEIDVARIYVMIVDWTAPHTVVSGLKKDEKTFLDTTQQKTLSEGKIIGYGDLQIKEPTAGDQMVDITIPISFYDTEATPGKTISLVIACSSSSKGDYMTGSTKNILYVDDFEWVY